MKRTVKNQRKRTLPPRLTPLAACLTAALAFSASGPLLANGSGNNLPRDSSRALLLDSVASGEAILSRLTDAQAASADVAMQRLLGIHNLGVVTGVTIPVSNCNDAGAGSLRAAVALASSGDTLDMSGLSCTLTLASAIVTYADDLTIQGNPNSKYPMISGNNTIEPFVHGGTGTLTLSGVTVKNGKFSSGSPSLKGAGGCIYSKGNVVLQDSARVKYCTAAHTGTGDATGGAIYSAGYTSVLSGSLITGSDAIANSGNALGGGIYAKGGTILIYGTVTNNSVDTSSGTFARGGGIYSNMDLTAKYANISGNSAASSGTSVLDVGGGAWISGSTFIARSSIYDNKADSAAAMLLGRVGTGTSGIYQSTIANNEASASNPKYGGGVYLGNASTINNCTISGNTEKNSADKKYGAGFLIKNGVAVTMSSTIVSANSLIDSSSSVLPSDIRGNSTTPATITGDHNLVGIAKYAATPGDTISSTDPILGTLKSNGGFTRTMAVLPGSPAIDQGNANGATTDQRGSGFLRTIGAAADIGSFELGGDTIFANGFD